VVLLFLGLLLRLHRAFPCPWPAANRLRLLLGYALALFFGVNFAGVKMVTWSHIQGYILYVVFVLGALHLLLHEVCGQDDAPRRRGRLAGAALLLLLAAFTHESGSAFAVCVGAVLAVLAWRRGQPRRAVVLLALFASILVLSQGANWLDRRCHLDRQPDVDLAALLRVATVERTLDHARRFLLYTLVQPFFPSCIDSNFFDEIRIPEPGDAVLRYVEGGPLLLVSYGVLALALGLAAVQFERVVTRRRHRSGLPFLLLPAALFALYGTAVVLGRMNLRDSSTVLARNSYYAYTPLLLLLLGLYYLYVRAPLPRSPATPVALGALLAGLAVLSVVSARQVHAITARVKDLERPLRARINFLQNLVDQHRHDPRFAVSFDPWVLDTLEGYHGVSEVEILFSRHLDHDNPTHVICDDGTSWHCLTAEEYRARFGGPRHRRLARFVRAGDHYNIFAHGSRYYGVLWKDGRFRPERDDHFYLLEGDSVAEVLGQVPVSVRRIREDLDTGWFIPWQTIVTPVEAYRGFEVSVSAERRAYAIGLEEGPLTPAHLAARRYLRCFQGTDPDDVKRQIDAEARQAKGE
jgi:hypothetical protein